MQPYQKWLTALAAAKRGGFALPPIDRGLPYSFTWEFAGDASEDAFTGALRAAPVDDTAPTALATITAVAGAFTGTVTPVTFSIDEAGVEALPSDADLDGVHTLYWDILHTPNAGNQYRLAAGYVEVLGGITNDDI